MHHKSFSFVFSFIAISAFACAPKSESGGNEALGTTSATRETRGLVEGTGEPFIITIPEGGPATLQVGARQRIVLTAVASRCGASTYRDPTGTYIIGVAKGVTIVKLSKVQPAHAPQAEEEADPDDGRLFLQSDESGKAESSYLLGCSNVVVPGPAKTAPVPQKKTETPQPSTQPTEPPESLFGLELP